MKRILIGIVAASAFLLSGVVFANGDALTPPAPAYAQTGFVFGANAGYGVIHTPHAYLWDFGPLVPVPGLTQTLSQSRKIGAFVWGAHLGFGFAISPKTVLGMEVGYQDLGKSTYKSSYTITYTGPAPITNTATASRRIYQSAIAVLLTGKHYVWRGLNVFGKFGVAFVRVQTKQRSDATAFNSTQRRQWKDAYDFNKVIWRLRPELAAGFGYTFLKNFDVYVMFKHIFANGNEEGWGVPVPSTSPTVTNDPTRLYVYGASSVVGGFTYTIPVRVS